MKKITKRVLIAFGVGAVLLAVTIGIILGVGTLASRDNSATVQIEDQVETITIYTDKATVVFVPEDEDRRIEASVNLWADEKIDVTDIAVISMMDSALIITEQPPNNKFLGLFPQPYELKITIYVPQDMIDDIGETK